MSQILEYLSSVHLAELASDPRVLFAAAVVFLVSAYMRWKSVLLLLFGVGGILAVMRYSGLEQGDASIDRNLIVFVGGSVAVGVVLIYFLFVKGD